MWAKINREAHIILEKKNKQRPEAYIMLHWKRVWNHRRKKIKKDVTAIQDLKKKKKTRKKKESKKNKQAKSNTKEEEFPEIVGVRAGCVWKTGGSHQLKATPT